MTRERTIVVIDDSDLVLEAARCALESAGYRVVTRNEAAGSMALVLLEDPDLVLIDVSMPGVEGDTLVRLFGAARPGGRPIVLLYSSLPAAELEVRARGCGAHGFISKNVRWNELVATVRSWLSAGAAIGDGGLGDGGLGGAAISDGGLSGRTRSAETEITSTTAVGSGTYVKARPSALLVDSDISTLSQVRVALLDYPITVDFALSASHAVRVLSGTSPFDVVVCNVDVGNTPGFALYRQVVSHDRRWTERFVFFAPSSDPGALRMLEGVFRGPVVRGPISGSALWQAITGRLDPQRVAS